MKNIFRLILLGGGVAVAIWLWGVLFPSPQKVIEKHLVKLSQLASFEPGEGELKRVSKVDGIGDLFDKNTEVTINVPGFQHHTFDGRDEILQAAMAARTAVKGLSVEFLDISISLGADGQSATAGLTAKTKISTENDLIVQELKFTFKKVDDDWLITRVETVRSLK